MGSSTPSEVAPPYEELYSRQASNSVNGYSRVSADEPDLERDAHRHDAAAAPAALELNETRTNPNGDHVHCEECDRQLERRERRRSKDQCCATVSRTMMTMSLFLMIFGIVAVLSWRRVRG